MRLAEQSNERTGRIISRTAFSSISLGKFNGKKYSVSLLRNGPQNSWECSSSLMARHFVSVPEWGKSQQRRSANPTEFNIQAHSNTIQSILTGAVCPTCSLQTICLPTGFPAVHAPPWKVKSPYAFPPAEQLSTSSPGWHLPMGMASLA
jgi:hypothetical protein